MTAPESSWRSIRNRLAVLKTLPAAIAGLCLLVLYIFSVPRLPSLALVGLPLYLLACALWVAHSILVVADPRYRADRRGSRRSVVTVVAVLLATVGLIVASVPLRARVLLSEVAMDRFARQVIAGEVAEGDVDLPYWVGLFRAERVERFPGGMRFIVAGAGLSTDNGFAFSPERRPPNLGGEDHFGHLSGPWYVWIEDF